MKTIRVVAAVICDSIETKSKIFATARGYGELKGGWEFPGGKVEPGETPQQALIREIKEELDTEIEVGELIDIVEYDYPNFHLTMYCFKCTVKSGDLVEYYVAAEPPVRCGESHPSGQTEPPVSNYCTMF